MNLKKITFCFIFLFVSILGQTQSSKYVVKLFLLDDCVICQSYTPLLNKLHEEYKDDFEFIGYFPNFRSKQEGINDFQHKYGITFELKTDYFKKVTNQYNVKITPEVIIENRATKELLYKGRIDDEFLSIGRRKRVVTFNDLAEALYKVKHKLPIVNKETEAIGCFINFDTFNNTK